MRHLHFAKLILVPLLSMGAQCASADDIDIYTGSTVNGAASNLLIILDNAAAWDANQTFTCTGFTVPASNVGKNSGFEQCGLYNAVNAISSSSSLLGNIKLGLMYFPTGPADGGQFVLPSPSPTPSSLLLMNSAGITAMKSAVSALDTSKDKSNNNQLAESFQEAWAFYQGQKGLSGKVYPGTNADSACGRNFIVYIALSTTNTKPQDPGNVGLNALTKATGAVQPTLTLPVWPGASGKYQSDPSDEWAKFMYSGTTADASLTYPSITTYTVILTDGTNPDYEQFLIGTANAGGGKYFLVKLGDTSGLAQALLQIFNEVQAVNSVFASPGLPVTSNAQGTYLNQVYLASFRPDADGKPRWLGNLKQYQFGVDTSVAGSPAPFLADASWADIDSVTGQATYPANTTAKSALSSAGTGFISPNAISYWTTRDTTQLPDSTGGFWVNKPGIGSGYDLADGQYVEKGGVGQQIRQKSLQDTYIGTAPTSDRKLYTCYPAASCTSSAELSTMSFNAANTELTAAALGISSPVYTAPISSISRTPTTVTVTLSASPSPAISNASTIVISGTSSGQFDGALSAASPTVSASTITYKLPAEKPTAPTGAYTATGATISQSTVSSLSRTTNSGWFTASATLGNTSFGSGTPVAAGDVISISGSTGYDGSNYTVTNVTGSTVQFKMQDSPSPYDGGANVWVGNNSNSANGTAGTAGSYASSTATGLIRGTNCTSCVNPLGQVLMVNIPAGTTNASSIYSVGNTVKISGSANYNSATGYKIIGLGAQCKVDVTTSSTGTVTTYTGTASVITTSPARTTTYTVCLDLGASFAYSPSLTSSGASSGTTASRPGAGVTRTVTGIVRAASTCPSSNLATATVTATAHGFAAASAVTLGRSDQGTNEGFNGTYTISNVTTNTFDIKVPTTPACTDNKGSISYQSSTNAGVSASTLINWVRGEDNVGDEPSPPDPASPALPMTVRGSVHGDVLHSRPAVINYGGSTGVVVFYGANDGVFRAVNGNQPPATNTRPSGEVASTAATYTPMGSCTVSTDCSIGGVPPGGELWGFIPSEFFSKLQRLYFNSPDLLLTNTPSGIVPTPTPKDYFFDGPAATYQTYDASGKATSAYIFLTARRGGRLMYAIDVTDPAKPKFMWKITNATSGFSELGQTWSQPKVAFVKGYLDGSSKPKPVLIFGAGYDGNGYNADGSTYLGKDDTDPPKINQMGRGMYIVDAMDGTLIWRAGLGGSGTDTTCKGNPCLLPAMTHSIAADITTVDPDLDGYVDRLYATDTGGNIWRVDLEAGAAPNLPATWQVTQLASLGGTATLPASTRKFLFPADVVVTNGFAAVLVGSGDREHPLMVQSGAYNTVNRFYMILDRTTGKDASAWSTVIDDSKTNSADAPTNSTLFDASTQPFNITTSVCIGSAPCKGYYVVLNQNRQSAADGSSTLGEQVVNAAKTIGGFTFFGTNQPKPADAKSCSANLGNARGYKINVLTGSGGFTLFDGGGLPPSPVGGRVAVYVNGVYTTLPFLIGGGGGSSALGGRLATALPMECSGPDCKSSLGLQNPVPTPKLQKKRTYWYRQIDQ